MLPSGHDPVERNAIAGRCSAVRRIGDALGQRHNRGHARFPADRRRARLCAMPPYRPGLLAHARAGIRSFSIAWPEQLGRRYRGNYRRDRGRIPGRVSAEFRDVHMSKRKAHDGRRPGEHCADRESRSRAATLATRIQRPRSPRCFDRIVRSSWQGNGPRRWRAACVRVTGRQIPRNADPPAQKRRIRQVLEIK